MFSKFLSAIALPFLNLLVAIGINAMAFWIMPTDYSYYLIRAGMVGLMLLCPVWFFFIIGLVISLTCLQMTSLPLYQAWQNQNQKSLFKYLLAFFLALTLPIALILYTAKTTAWWRWDWSVPLVIALMLILWSFLVAYWQIHYRRAWYEKAKHAL